MNRIFLTTTIILACFPNMHNALIGLRSATGHSYRKAQTYHHPNVASRKPEVHPSSPSNDISEKSRVQSDIQGNNIQRNHEPMGMADVHADIDKFFINRFHQHELDAHPSTDKNVEPNSQINDDRKNMNLIEDASPFPGLRQDKTTPTETPPIHSATPINDYNKKRRCRLNAIQGCGVRLLRKTFKRRKHVCDYFEEFTKCIIDRMRGCGRKRLSRSMALLNKVKTNLTQSSVCNKEQMKPIRLSTQLRRIHRGEMSKCRPEALVRCAVTSFMTSLKDTQTCAMIPRYKKCLEKAVEQCGRSSHAKILHSVTSVKKNCKRGRS